MSEPTVVSYSEIDDFRQCPHKHWIGWNQRWRKRTPSEAQLIGTRFHRYLELRYRGLHLAQRCKPTWADAFGKRAVDELANEIDRQLVVFEDTGERFGLERAELLYWMAEGYEARWGHTADPADKETNWHIVGVEVPFEVELPLYQWDYGRLPLYLKGKIDLVIRDAVDRLWIIDHKTFTSRSASRDALHFELQPALYNWVWNEYFADRYGRADGVMFNRARRDKLKREMTLEERYERIAWSYTDDHLERVAHDAAQTAGLIHWGRNTERHPTSDCTWKCDYGEPCLTGLSHGPDAERAELADGEVYVHEPRGTRRKAYA